MNKALLILIPLVVLIVLEGIAWNIYQASKEESETVPEVRTDSTSQTVPSSGLPTPNVSSEVSSAETENEATEDFPEPTMVIVNGQIERTIHMGVRQYVWDPAIITVKQGELVRLIIHNADVKHGLVIPALGVNQDILPDGAVIEFVASKRGAFEFFCSVWCGEGHMEMQGSIVIE